MNPPPVNPPPVPPPVPPPTEAETIRWEQDADGIVLLTMDDPVQSANTLNARYRASMAAVLDRLDQERDTITGVVLTSAKRTFFAGADLRDLIRIAPADRQAAFDEVTAVKDQLRRLETFGRPVVAAINGAALGGGLELALAAHHRIAAEVPGAQLGLPEVTLGLLPAGGGVVRTVRLLGITNALLGVLLQGQRLTPAKAREVGLVHQLVGSLAELVPAAKAWIRTHPTAVAPWDTPGYRIPGGSPASPGVAATLPAFPANLRRQLGGTNSPAPQAILAAAVEGAQVDVDTAFVLESRHFVDLVTGQVAKNMIQAFFFDMQHITSGAARPADEPPFQPSTVAILGVGMLGAAIAFVCAKAGIRVVLRDPEEPVAAKGRAYAESLVARAVRRGRMSPAAGDALLARITPTADAADLAGADVVIDTTGGEPPAEVADGLAPDALRCSTSATPAGDVVGLHFFTPVDKAPLVEILAGPKTGDAALARAFDLVRQLHRTPIVVHGPFTGRVVTTFLDEAVAMAGEGAPAASIEQAGIQAGYPAPALRGLGLAERVTKDAAAGPAGPIPFEDMTQRLLFAAALETVRCLDEGVLRSEPEANIGSIMGVGFPAWTGGALQYVRGYPGGQPAFVARARELAERYGDRFDPPDSLAGGAGG